MSKRKKTSKRDHHDAASRPRVGALRTVLRHPAIGALIVFAVAFALYANTLHHDFVWDDLDLIVHNPSVRTLDAASVYAIFTQDFWPTMQRGGQIRMDTRFQSDKVAYYRPLVTLSYHIDYQLFKGQPGGFHWMNVLWNALACAMVFVFVYVLFGNAMLAMITGLLFAAHPMHTENVAWISGRTDVLATLGSLASLTLYVLARRRRNPWLLAAGLVAFLLALFSKEVAVGVPLLVALLEIGPFAALLSPQGAADPRAWRLPNWRAMPGIILFFAAFAFYLLLKHHATGAIGTMGTPIATGAVGRAALPLSIFAGYIYKTILPISLTAEYAVPVPSSFADPQTMIGAILAALILWAAVRFRANPLIVFGTAVFLVGVAPVIQVIPIAQLSAERFLYFPSLGVALILGGFFIRAIASRWPALSEISLRKLGGSKPMPRGAATALAPVFVFAWIFFAGKTVARNPLWKNNDILFSETAKQAPQNPRILVQVGMNAQKNGDIEGAIRAYQEALQLNPDYAPPNWNLALIYLQRGEPDKAKVHLERAAAGGPDFRAAYYHLAMIEKNAGNTRAARRYAEQFLALYDKNDRIRAEAMALVSETDGD